MDPDLKKRKLREPTSGTGDSLVLKDKFAHFREVLAPKLPFRLVVSDILGFIEIKVQVRWSRSGQRGSPSGVFRVYPQRTEDRHFHRGDFRQPGIFYCIPASPEENVVFPCQAFIRYAYGYFRLDRFRKAFLLANSFSCHSCPLIGGYRSVYTSLDALSWLPKKNLIRRLSLSLGYHRPDLPFVSRVPESVRVRCVSIRLFGALDERCLDLLGRLPGLKCLQVGLGDNVVSALRLPIPPTLRELSFSGHGSVDLSLGEGGTPAKLTSLSLPSLSLLRSVLGSDVSPEWPVALRSLVVTFPIPIGLLDSLPRDRIRVLKLSSSNFGVLQLVEFLRLFPYLRVFLFKKLTESAHQPEGAVHPRVRDLSLSETASGKALCQLLSFVHPEVFRLGKWSFDPYLRAFEEGFVSESITELDANWMSPGALLEYRKHLPNLRRLSCPLVFNGDVGGYYGYERMNFEYESHRDVIVGSVSGLDFVAVRTSFEIDNDKAILVDFLGRLFAVVRRGLAVNLMITSLHPVDAARLEGLKLELFPFTNSLEKEFALFIRTQRGCVGEPDVFGLFG